MKTSSGVKEQSSLESGLFKKQKTKTESLYVPFIYLLFEFLKILLWCAKLRVVKH